MPRIFVPTLKLFFKFYLIKKVKLITKNVYDYFYGFHDDNNIFLKNISTQEELLKMYKWDFDNFLEWYHNTEFI